MKYLLIILLFSFTSINAYNSGGSVHNLQHSLKNLEKEQVQIEQKLKEISSFLDDYTDFASSYKRELISIIKSGAKCITDDNRYKYYYNKYGSNNDYTKMYKNFVRDCRYMKKNRLGAMKSLDVEFDNLKNKVDELVHLKEIATTRANTIKEYIDGIKSTLKVHDQYNRL